MHDDSSKFAKKVFQTDEKAKLISLFWRHCLHGNFMGLIRKNFEDVVT